MLGHTFKSVKPVESSIVFIAQPRFYKTYPSKADTKPNQKIYLTNERLSEVYWQWPNINPQTENIANAPPHGYNLLIIKS